MGDLPPKILTHKGQKFLFSQMFKILSVACLPSKISTTVCNILYYKSKIHLLFTLVNCATISNGDDEFCNCNTCSENEGDCDYHYHCLGSLLCGSSNCLGSLGFDSGVDCCYHPTPGSEHFCTTANPCDEHEGDCDSNEECKFSLDCGSNNCPDSLGFDSGVDCCYVCSGTCGSPSWIGDNNCDDENNNCGCGWDGGACCGANVKKTYCKTCACLDPSKQ